MNLPFKLGSVKSTQLPLKTKQEGTDNLASENSKVHPADFPNSKSSKLAPTSPHRIPPGADPKWPRVSPKEHRSDPHCSRVAASGKIRAGPWASPCRRQNGSQGISLGKFDTAGIGYAAAPEIGDRAGFRDKMTT